MRRGAARGFTMLELLIALAAVVILLAFLVPRYMSLQRRTHATQAMADLYTVRAAGCICFTENGDWPAEVGTGVAPKELARYLPKGFLFHAKDYQLDWENWRLADGTARAPRTGILIGVSVVSRDPRLLREVQKVMADSTFRRISKKKSTLAIVGLSGEL